MKSVIGQFSKASKGEVSDQEVTRAKWVMLETTVVQLTWPILSNPPPVKYYSKENWLPSFSVLGCLLS